MDEQQGCVNAATRRTVNIIGAAEQAESKLRRSAYLALQHLSCEAHAGVLTLRGRLPSYYLKQVAQAVVAAVEGVEHIDNQIEVVPPAAAAVNPDRPGAVNP
jgi:osmotically-inducible protein OsmY